VQNGKDQKNIHSRIQGKSGLGDHQRQQEYGGSLPLIQLESGPAFTLEEAVSGQCGEGV
jgi:hypothetical protein